MTLNAALDEGRAIDARTYREALMQRERAIDTLTQWLAPFDAVAAPPAPGAAPLGIESTGDPSCCALLSLVGFPAVALPIGQNGANLPLGLQLAAKARRRRSALVCCVVVRGASAVRQPSLARRPIGAPAR